MRSFIPCILVLGLMMGCASYTGTAVSGSSNVITLEELETCSASNAYEAIQLLRPRLLEKIYRKNDQIGYVSGSGQTGSREVTIYFDGARRTGLESLSSVGISGIKEIRYLDPEDATMRYGTGHSGGALVIKSM